MYACSDSWFCCWMVSSGADASGSTSMADGRHAQAGLGQVDERLGLDTVDLDVERAVNHDLDPVGRLS